MQNHIAKLKIDRRIRRRNEEKKPPNPNGGFEGETLLGKKSNSMTHGGAEGCYEVSRQWL